MKICTHMLLSIPNFWQLIIFQIFHCHRECLSGAIEHCDAPQVACPYKDDNYSCDMTLLDREIKAVIFLKMFLNIVECDLLCSPNS